MSSHASAPSSHSTAGASNPALQFTGGQVDFGDPAALGLAQFTVETWFRRDATGSTAYTGTGGMHAEPLVTKGRAEADGDNRDMNFFLGISGGVIAADFEEGTGGSSPGQNHPVFGVTSIANDVWYHAAVTYDGSSMRLYLNGSLESSLLIDEPPQSNSSQDAGLAVAFNSSGSASGSFEGALDEVRIWDRALTQSEIQANKDSEVEVAQPGLVARWSLNEGSGSSVSGSAGTTVNGTIQGSTNWIQGPPLNSSGNQIPDLPVVVQPVDEATLVPTTPILEVVASDPDSQQVTVSFYGRVVPTPIPDFTLIVLPDTQYYSSSQNGGQPAMFDAQTSWVAQVRDSLNVVYVAHVGDCVQNGDNAISEWQVADQAFSFLEDPQVTQLADGIPYGIAIGNHDQWPFGDPDGTTTYYNQFFGTPRFASRAYYGGHYGSNNDNHYSLFSVGGQGFIVIDMEFDSSPDTDVLDWADNLLSTHSDRLGFVVRHELLNNNGNWRNQGEDTYDALKHNPNLFMMFCGHRAGEARRSDTFNGSTVHTLLANYQTESNGGNGKLRIYTFRPSLAQMEVQTYSPWTDSFDTGSSSEFTMAIDAFPQDPFVFIDSLTVPNGGHAAVLWPGLDPDTQFEWYAVVDDGIAQSTGPTQRFTTSSMVSHPIVVSATAHGTVTPSGTVYVGDGGAQQFDFLADPGFAVQEVWVDGVPVGGPLQYLFAAVSTTHTLHVVFDTVAASDGTRPRLAFEPVFPNPIRGQAQLSFHLRRTGPVSLVVYDIRGREVQRLVDEVRAPGPYVLQWSADSAKPTLAAGIYLVALEAEGTRMVRRVVLLR